MTLPNRIIDLLGEAVGGGALNFFQVGVCSPDFRSVGLANWYLPLKRGVCELKISKFGGLWTENFPIWGACELKISKVGGLWANLIWVKIEAVETKISKFSQKGGLVNWSFCLKWDPCELHERCEKGVFRAAHPHAPFLGQSPPPPRKAVHTFSTFWIKLWIEILQEKHESFLFL